MTCVCRHGFSTGLSGTSPPKQNSYPNPGHLGSSSHVAIFNQIPSGRTFAAEVNAHDTPVSDTHHPYPLSAELEHTVDAASRMLKELVDRYSIASMQDLVLFWLASGVNLALAEPFVKSCTETMNHVRTLIVSFATDWQSMLGRYLLQNSARPLRHDKQTSLSSFLDQFCGTNVRWETLGIFVLAVVRSALDIPLFPGLYTTET